MLWLLRALIAIGCVGLIGWMVLAIYLSPLEPEWLRTALPALLLVGVAIALVGLRPWRRVAMLIVAAFAVVLVAWQSIEASNDRQWQADVAQLPFAEIRGDQVTVHNVRNVSYRSETDFTVHYEDREIDLSKIRSMDLFLIYWGSPMIAHTIMSWGFEGDDYLAISIETRKEEGESYSALRGFFRQYEITYIVSDERDVIGLRSNHRGEDVYVYRLDVPPERARTLLNAYFEAINELYEQPEWYNALLDNCTTTIQHLAGPNEERDWMSWRLIVNGYLDELAYEIGAIDQSLPFSELKKRSYINDRAIAVGSEDPRFSLRIRAGVPSMSEGSDS